MAEIKWFQKNLNPFIRRRFITDLMYCKLNAAPSLKSRQHKTEERKRSLDLSIHIPSPSFSTPMREIALKCNQTKHLTFERRKSEEGMKSQVLS